MRNPLQWYYILLERHDQYENVVAHTKVYVSARSEDAAELKALQENQDYDTATIL